MNYSRIAGGMMICSLLLGSGGAAVAASGHAAGVTDEQTAVPPNASDVAPDNSQGAVPAKDVQQLDQKLKTEPEQK